MNEQAINDAYSLFKSKGYNGSLDEFVELISSNQDALNDAYSLFTSGGYNGDIAEFSELIGLKKKEPSGVSSQEGQLASPMETPTLATSQGQRGIDGEPLRKPLVLDEGAKQAIQAQPVTTAPEAAGYQVPTEMKSIGFEPVYQPTMSDIVGQVDLTVDEETKNKLGMAFGIGAEVVNRIVAPNSTRGQALSDVNNFVDNTLTAYNVGILSAQRTNNLADAVPDMERVAYLNKELKKESEKLLSSKMGTSGSDFFTMLASNPVTFLTEVLTTSAVQMTGNIGALKASDAVIAVGLGLGTGGMGMSSYLAGMNSMNAEMSARIMDELEARGYDINDPKQLEAAFSDKQVMDEVYSKVDAPATVIGLLDALSAGVAGRLGKPVYEVGAQMATGMAGEAAAQVISEGGITNVAGILTEGIAELPGGLVETAFGAKTADIARKAEIKEQIRSVEAAIESEQDPDTKSVLQSLRDNLVREKNKIYSDYVEFVNGLPEDEVEKLNALNEEIVKNNKAIDAVEDPQIKDGLRKRRDALLKEIEELEQQKPTEDAVQEQAAGEVPVQPEARPGEEVAEGAPQAEPEVTAEAGVKEEVAPEVTAEERATIDALFPEAEKPLPNLLINEKGAVPVAGKAKVRRDVVIKAAKMGAQAIASILPNVNIVVHAASEEFVNAVGEDLRGYYDPSTSTIHVNMDKAGLSTVAHEIFHAILLDKVKNNDEQAAAVARTMFNSVAKALPKGSSLRIEIEDFAKGYDANIQNEEKISELLGKMASEYRAISKPGRSSIMNFIVKIADSVGFNIGKFTKTDQDVVDLLNTLSVKIREGAEITQEDLAVLEEGGSINIGEPTTINKPKSKGRKRVSFPDKPLPLSFVTKADKIDLMALINEIVEKNQKVWFWMADQLGRGEYYDVTSGIMHYLDAGPSFALDPENRKAGVLWASGLSKQTLERNAAEADYIFFISGSPEKAKLFNKNIISVIGTRIEGNGGFAAFKEEALAASKVGALNAILNSVNSVEELRESPKRKAFLNLILEQQSKKTPLVDVLKKYDAFFDPNEFRDSFYAENGFGMKDILLVGKPTGVGGRANHSTYHTEILGEVVGVPDIVLDSWTIMPEELKAKYDKALTDAQQMKSIAGDTGIVRKVAKPRGRAQILSEFQKASATTQIKGTTGSYKKAAQKLNALGVVGPVLDYGAGIGLGSDAIRDIVTGNVESLELNPEKWEGRVPVTYTSSEDIKGKYDGIVSLNVINVVPKDVRDFIIKDIFDKLTEDGVALISSRTFKGDIDKTKNFKKGAEPKAYIIDKKTKGGETIEVYQKGFDGDELLNYVQKLLGKDAVVKKDNSFGAIGVAITKGRPAEVTKVKLNKITEAAGRAQKGLITLTENEVMKYARIGVQDRRLAQASSDIGLQGVRFDREGVEKSILDAFNTMVSDVKEADLYNGRPVAVSQDSDAITKAMLFDAQQAEEQGASVAAVERMKAAVNNQEARVKYLAQYQKTQLDEIKKWISYLEQSEYDPAFKYLILDAILTNNYDLKTDKYIKRNEKTLRGITPFDAGSLAMLYNQDSDALLKDYTQIQADNAENIAKSNALITTDEGTWVKFSGGSQTPDADIELNGNALSQLVQNTPWCTKSLAKSQLTRGDFYVYTTPDANGKPTPRLAVRMDGTNVGEVRGVDPGQAIEPEMLPVAEKFLLEETPGDSGKRWLESIKYSKSIKSFIEEIKDKPLSMDDLSRYAELLKGADNNNVDYGENGMVTRMRSLVEDKIRNDKVVNELKGAIAMSNEDFDFAKTKIIFSRGQYGKQFDIDAVGITSTLNVIDDFDDASRLLKQLAKAYLIKNGVPEYDINSVIAPLTVYSDNNTKSTMDLPYSLLKYFERKGNLQQSFIRQELRNQLNDMLEASPLERIIGDFEFNSIKSLDLNLPPKLKTISGDVLITDASLGSRNLTDVGGDLVIDADVQDIGSIRTVGGKFIFSDLDRPIKSLNNLESVGGDFEIRGPLNIKEFTNLKRVGGSLYIYEAEELESMGSLEYVGSNLAGNVYENSVRLPSLKSLGELYHVGNDIYLGSNTPNLESLGKLKSVGTINFELVRDLRKKYPSKNFERVDGLTDKSIKLLNEVTKFKGNVEKVRIAPSSGSLEVASSEAVAYEQLYNNMHNGKPVSVSIELPQAREIYAHGVVIEKIVAKNARFISASQSLIRKNAFDWMPSFSGNLVFSNGTFTEEGALNGLRNLYGNLYIPQPDQKYKHWAVSARLVKEGDFIKSLGETLYFVKEIADIPSNFDLSNVEEVIKIGWGVAEKIGNAGGLRKTMNDARHLGGQSGVDPSDLFNPEVRAQYEENKRRYKASENLTKAQGRKQIIGENAKLSANVRENLLTATTLEALGRSKEKIFLATGWQKGVDGKWRYEILDGDIVMSEFDYEAGGKKDMGGGNVALTSDRYTNKSNKLGDIYDSPELYAAYPQLKDIEVEISVIELMFFPYDGGYSPNKKKITIKAANFEFLASVLVHEIQHAIQHIEGFAWGSNEKMAEKMLKKNKEEIKIKEKIEKGIKSIDDFSNEVKIFDQLWSAVYQDAVKRSDFSLYSEIELYGTDMTAAEFFSKDSLLRLFNLFALTPEKLHAPKIDSIIKAYNALPENTKAALSDYWFEQSTAIRNDINEGPPFDNIKEYFARPISSNLKESLKKYTPHAVYRRAAGEVEARNVQTRMEKLAGIPASKRPSLSETEDVSITDQIIFFLDKEKGKVTKPIPGRAQKLAVDYIQEARDAKIKDSVIRDFLLRNGYSDESITEAFEALAKSEERLWKEVDGIIKKSKDRKASRAKTVENVINYILGSALYERATDVKREELIREARKMLSVREKSAPSIAKIFGKMKDVAKVTMKERDLLKKQILDQARGAKDAISAWRMASRQLAEVVASLRKAGKISAAQASAVIRRFSAVNVLNESSIKSFVDYMAKIFADADYAQRISDTRKMLSQAKKNVQKKIGVSSSLAPSLMRLFSIDPTMIPNAMLDEYMHLVSEFGQRATVLTLPEVGDAATRAAEILDAINEEYSKVDELASRFAAYEYKVMKDGKIAYAETLKQMQEDGYITDDELELMQKYKADIFPTDEKVKLTDTEKSEKKQEAIDAIGEMSVDAGTLSMRDERALAKEIARLIKTGALNGLTLEELNNLYKVIGNINNGYLPHYAEVIKEKMQAIENASELSSAVKGAKPLALSSIVAKTKALFTGKSSMLELIRRNPLKYIDQVFGDFKTTKIFDAVLKAASEAQALFESEYNKVKQSLDRAEEAIAKSFKYDPNKVLMSKYKIQAYLLELENQSNPNNRQVHSAADYLRATISEIKKGRSSLTMEEADMLQEILNTYADADGNINLETLFNSFNAAEKKAIGVIQSVNNSMVDKAVFTSAIIRGEKIDPINNYVHHNVLYDYKEGQSEGMSLVDAYNTSMRPSTKAKSLIERTGKITPLNFDAFASAKRGAKFVLTDYHLTSPIRTARTTFLQAQQMLEKEGMTKQQQDILNAIERAFEESVSNLLVNNYVESTMLEEAMTWIAKQGYRTMLAGVPRAVSEFMSNVSFALLNDPKALMTGSKLMDIIMSPNAVEILNNVKSKQTARLFSGNTFGGRFVDTSILGQSSAVGVAKAKPTLLNKLSQGWARTGKKYKNIVELGADALITTPDKLVMRPLWFGSFANEFKRITGEDVDFNKIAENDEAYMAKHADAIEASKELADTRSVQAGASDNVFLGILKGTPKPNQSAMIRAYNQFNGFMQRFLIYEYTAARTGLAAAVGNGSMTKRQGVALLAAATTRMVTYTMLTQLLGSLMISMVFGDDEDDDKNIIQKLMQSMMSAFTSLLLGRDFGNVIKTPMSYIIEGINEEYFDFLRKGEYNQYEDSIQFSIISRDKKKKQEFVDIAFAMAGPYGPAFKTAKLAYDKLTEADKKQVDAIIRQKRTISERLPLEVLGNLGYVPFYRDIRKILMEDIYRGMDKPSGKGSTASYEELKKISPQMYEEIMSIKKEMESAEVNQMAKDIQKMVKDMESEME